MLWAICIPTGDFRIPAHVYGQLISTSGRGVGEMEIPVIQWDVRYDGWQLLKGEIQELLQQISRGAGEEYGPFFSPFKCANQYFCSPKCSPYMVSRIRIGPLRSLFPLATG